MNLIKKIIRIYKEFRSKNDFIEKDIDDYHAFIIFYNHKYSIYVKTMTNNKLEEYCDWEPQHHFSLITFLSKYRSQDVLLNLYNKKSKELLNMPTSISLEFKKSQFNHFLYKQEKLPSAFQIINDFTHNKKQINPNNKLSILKLYFITLRRLNSIPDSIYFENKIKKEKFKKDLITAIVKHIYNH